ncbi:zinc finger and BTB domain-containing protein 32-like isoform X7 [Mizuhopecten yessoensis]|uniref:zinc finger and BTB domain-containing protein 32-like isoform X7 n=1 Tax=Mizuhopecten yessoensis TaxID=6573 RepID=UPI000B45CA7C|nr:zinc finger and BTB domain-containing protein 32-like isoform X7 [Mizuhopecten yessoensis]
MSYQKFYSNQIHSSSLLCQLSHLWKSQLLCDALIRAGPVTIKAHRLVLIAACPMLQSMENASAGSHLEVRLAADIKQESVNTFLQYLYEGFMMLTEDNVRDVEKVARLLQVDGVIKCCADFYKALKTKTGVAIQPGHNYKYSFQDLIEFRHVRASEIIKSTQDRMTKRTSEFSRPGSPGGKRQRMYMHPGSPSVDRADDHHSMSDSYKASHLAPDPWERVPRLGSGMGRQGATGRNSQPGVIEIVEDSLEIVQTEPINKDPNKPSDSRQTVQKSVAISIASQITDSTDLRVVNITGSNRDGSNTTSTTSSSKSSSHAHQESSFPPKSNVLSSPLTSLQQSFSSSGAMHRMPDMSSHVMPGPSFRQERAPEHFHIPNFSSTDLELVQVPKPNKMQEAAASTSSSQSQRQPFPVSLSPVGASSKASFAIGSASQSPSSQPMGSPMAAPTSTPIQPAQIARSHSQGSSAGHSDSGMERASPVVDSGKDPSSYKEKQEPSPSSTAEMTPDISIVKVEGQDKDDTGGLDMYVDMPPDGTMTMHSGTGEESDNDHDEALEEWAREESANETGDMSQMDPGGAKDAAHPYNIDLQGDRQTVVGSVVSRQGMFQGQTRGQASDHWGVLPPHPVGVPRLLSEVKHSYGVGAQFPYSVQTPMFFADDSNTGEKRQYMNLSEPGTGQGQCLDGSITSSGSMSGHRLVRNTGTRYKPCVLCQLKKVRTKSGWYVNTYFKCLACDVPLCKSPLRDCFRQYHNYIEPLDKS